MRKYNQRLALFENDTKKTLDLIWEDIKDVKEWRRRQDKLEERVDNHDVKIFAIEHAIKK